MTTSPALVSEFTAKTDPALGAIVERLVAVVDGSGHELDAAVKWRQLTFAHRGDFHHWICAVAVTKRAVGLNFHFGGLLDDPDGLFKSGSSRFLRKLEYLTLEDIDEPVLLGLLSQAIDRLDYFRDNWKAIQAGSIPATASKTT
jgi:hypothetical protein